MWIFQATLIIIWIDCPLGRILFGFSLFHIFASFHTFILCLSRLFLTSPRKDKRKGNAHRLKRGINYYWKSFFNPVRIPTENGLKKTHIKVRVVSIRLPFFLIALSTWRDKAPCALSGLKNHFQSFPVLSVFPVVIFPLDSSKLTLALCMHRPFPVIISQKNEANWYCLQRKQRIICGWNNDQWSCSTAIYEVGLCNSHIHQEFIVYSGCKTWTKTVSPFKKNGFRTLPLFAERVTIEVYVCDNFSHLVNELSKRRLLQF